MDHAPKKLYELSPQKKALLNSLLKQKGIVASNTSEHSQTSTGPTRRSDPAIRPLSFAQQRLWFLDQLDPGNVTYTIPLAFSLHGLLHYTALVQSLHAILMRHEVLRSTITNEAGTPEQRLKTSLPDPLLPVIDLSHLPFSSREKQQQQFIDNEAKEPFDLARGPLVRLRLLRLQEKAHILLLTIHHIVFDGWSANVMNYELAMLYNAYTTGKPMPLSALPVQYTDYAVWQQKWLSGERKQQQLAYWKKQLAGPPAPLELPLDYPRPDKQTFHGELCDFHMTKESIATLHTICQRTDTTLFMVLLAAFEILLFRYSEQTDFVIGTPVANRSHSEVEGLIGLFVNTLALRANLAGNPTGEEVLQRVRTTALNGYSNQDIPFEQIVETLPLPRDISRPPLFQVMFSLTHTAPSASLHLNELKVGLLPSYTHTAKVDLTLFLEESPQGLQGSLEYNTDLFTRTTIDRFIKHYQHLLQVLPDVLQQPIARIPLLSADEQWYLQQLGSAEQVAVEITSLHRAFEAQVALTPWQDALTYHHNSLTYFQLNQFSNQLAQRLIQQGIGPGDFVGLYMQRSLELVIGLLGIVKSGAAYVPLDPTYPAERLAFILADTRAAALVTHTALHSTLPAYTGSIFDVDTITADMSASKLANPAPRGVPDDIAYSIYTSGSTGRPKGVMVSRLNVLNTFAAMERCLPPQQPATWLAITSFAFDISVIELLWTFTHGFHVIVQDEFGKSNQEIDTTIATQLTRYSVTHLQGTPALAQLLLADAATRDSLQNLNYLILGGEPFPATLATQLKQLLPNTTIINGYGPTETTIYATLWPIETVEQRIPIGKPLLNTTAYILDKFEEFVPAGNPGELFIGGAGVATGYLQRPDLTAERFVPDPFSQQPGARLYRTGDKVTYRPDGVLEYLGRLDQQVKINGYRIELGEIEALLNQHPLVRENVVLLREDIPGEKRLVAYIVTEGETLSARALAEFLSTHLPSYMLPSHFISLPSLPLTSNGKVHRRALPEPSLEGPTQHTEQSTIRISTSIEIQITHIWEKLLQVHPINVTDNFFTLGGHSLLAVRLLAQLQAMFSVELPLSILFQAPTIEQLARALQQRVHTRAPLVALQTVADTRPFFCIHPIGGEIFCYVQLAHYLGRSIYALQMPDLAHEQTYIPIEQLAARYIAALQQVQPTGPYMLGGWSLGGIIAFEMAQQLNKQHATVAFLALIDSDAPALHQLSPINDRQAMTYFAHDLSALFNLPLAPSASTWEELSQPQQLSRLVEQLQQAQILPSGTGLVQMEQLFRSFKSNLLAVQQYHPQPYTGPVTFFNATDRPESAHQAPERGWAALIPSANRTLYQLPGTHYTLLQVPQVEALAQQLASSLDHASLST